MNKIADENTMLRKQLDEQRRQTNSGWEELQIYKVAARSRRDRIIQLTQQIANLTKQKMELANYAQVLCCVFFFVKLNS